MAVTEKRVHVVHVNTHLIKKNAVRLRKGMTTALSPPLTAKPKHGGKVAKGNTIAIMHKGVEVARVVYRPLDPLKSGAVAWVETENEVEVVPDPVPPAVPTVAAPTLFNADLTGLLLKLLVERHEPEIRQMLDDRKPAT